MKKLIPFKKEIIFKTNLSEITSISLEHTLQANDENIVSGEFIVSGEYKMVDTSVNVESFSFNIPFEVNIDEKYMVDNIIIDIYDFYYEIINNNVLSLNIEIIIDNLKEKPLIENHEPSMEDRKEEKEEVIDEKKEEVINEDKLMEKEDLKEDVSDNEVTQSLFDNFDPSSETYTTYKVYIVREGDTLDLLIQNYGISKEELIKYNSIDELSIGDRLIIPSKSDEKD